MLINPTISLNQYKPLVPNTIDGGYADSGHKLIFDGGYANNGEPLFKIDGGYTSESENEEII